MRAWVVSILALVAACTSGEPSPPPLDLDPGAGARGQAFAAMNCASCHAIHGGDTTSPRPQATAFQVLADTPGMTGTALNVWLHTAHPTMPHLQIEPDQVDDLAAYLASIKTPR